MTKPTPMVSSAAETLETYTRIINSFDGKGKVINPIQRSALKDYEQRVVTLFQSETKDLSAKLDRILNRERVERGKKR